MRPLTPAILATAALVLAAAATDASAREERLIRRCTALGAGDISMQAKFEDRGSRRKFSVEFEAATPGTFKPGDRIVFKVAGRTVGRDALVSVVGGDVVAELNLDTRGGEPGDDQKPFPPNFPTIQSGTKVTLYHARKAVLGCRLS